ncbi:hypothetical protein L6164_002006 [Bauhinia variegata]|uniref:Uncharacterized protein n=1 Tax=Bauhinia variegata TaxID=167791 RepID=A0ACB9PX09_BAUVA|nr:hypothetical protein L6164_002006 [Bauhinia variegata]
MDLYYRLNLDGFPGVSWAFTFFSDIEDLGPDESRKVRFVLPDLLEISKAGVNVEENARGKYSLYEPRFTNLSLPFVLSFRHGKTSDSSKGPLPNAMEKNKYLEKNDGSQYVCCLVKICWEIFLWTSPKLTGLVELFYWMHGLEDHVIPEDISCYSCLVNICLTSILASRNHLENNQLTGLLPSSLVNLPNLREL